MKKLIVLLVLVCCSQCFAGWVSPTADNGAAGWNNPANAYDENEDTNTSVEVAWEESSAALELSRAAISCDSVRVKLYASERMEFEVAIYYNANWHTVTPGVTGSFETLSLGGTYTVDKIKFIGVNEKEEGAGSVFVYEVDFNEVTVSVPVIMHSYRLRR